MKQKRKTLPLVSVVMPVYNAGEFLADAIESILSQTYQDFEFIIVNDASTDDSLAIIKKYKRLYPQKIRVIDLKKNLNNGGDSCANEGYRIAKGKFIARMDADDIADPTRLGKQIAYLNKHKDVIVLGTQAYVINREGKIAGEKLEPTSDSEIRKSYFVFHPMIHPSVMIRRSLLPMRPDLYKIRYNANNDLLTFFELLQYGKFANLPEKLMYYRIHGKNDSLIDPKGRFFNTLHIRLDAFKNLGYKPTLTSWFLNVVQLTTVVCFPPRVITFLYMLWRGLNSKDTRQEKSAYSTAYSYSSV